MTERKQNSKKSKQKGETSEKPSEEGKKEDMTFKKYCLRFNEVELDRYREAAKDKGYNTLSKLIRECLDAFMRDPSIVYRIPSKDDSAISGDLEKKVNEVIDLIARREQRDEQAREDREAIKRLAVKGLENDGMSMGDIYMILEGVNQSGEGIFDD